MRKAGVLTIFVFLLGTVNFTLADTFGTGANQFTIDFVNISGDSGNLGSWYVGSDNGNTVSFSGVNHGDYRMGKFEITNNQWNKFKAAYGAVTGSPTDAYRKNSVSVANNVPSTNISWYEAAQFVNWLNTSKGYQAAYKFTGTIHTNSYTFAVWGAGDADGTNLYRNKNAKYFLPTENEWVKAAYWNGSALQTYATKAGQSLTQGNGTSGTGWNYNNGPYGPWAVGSGSQELNGTYDMMGNLWEWMESPRYAGSYSSGIDRVIRGGAYGNREGDLKSSTGRYVYNPMWESDGLVVRVASVPEPTTLLLLAIGGLLIKKR